MGDAHVKSVQSLQGWEPSVMPCACTGEKDLPALLHAGPSAALCQPCHQLHGASAEQDAPETTGFSESLGNQDTTQVPRAAQEQTQTQLRCTISRTCFNLNATQVFSITSPPPSSTTHHLMNPHLLPSFFPHLNSAVLLFPALASGTTLGERGPGSVSFGCKRCRHSLTAQAPGCIVCC